MSKFLAVLAVFLSFLEKKIDGMIDSPEILVWASIMLKTFKGWFTVTIFVVNGSANDFFIGAFFLATSLLGAVYFSFDNTLPPNQVTGKRDDKNISSKVKNLRDAILIKEFSNLEGHGYGYVVVSTIFLFLLMMLITLYSPYVPVKLLGLRANDSFVPSSLGFSATILILYNAISWPTIKAAMISRKLSE